MYHYHQDDALPGDSAVAEAKTEDNGDIRSDYLSAAAAASLAVEREQLLEQIIFSREEGTDSDDDAIALAAERGQLLEQILFNREEGTDSANDASGDSEEEDPTRRIQKPRGSSEKYKGKEEEGANVHNLEKRKHALGFFSVNGSPSCAVSVGIPDGEQSLHGAAAVDAGVYDREEVSLPEEDHDLVVAKAHASVELPSNGELLRSTPGAIEELLRAPTPGAIAVCGNVGGDDSMNLQEELQDVEQGGGQDPEEQLGGSHITTSTTVTAVTVDEDIAEIEERVRNTILKEAVEASAVVATPQATQRQYATRNCQIGGLVLVMLLALGAAVATTISLSSKKGVASKGSGAEEGNQGAQMTSPDSKLSTLDVVLERGVVRCGLYDDAPGFSSYNEETEKLEGFNIDQCRAISLAVFGTPDRIEPVIVSPTNRFQMLADRSMDVLTQTVTHTMGRDIYEPTAEAGFTFSTPYFYSGMAFAGIPDMVACAESIALGNQPSEGCEDLRVCVLISTTQVPRVKELLPETIPVVIVFSVPDGMYKLLDGQCNVFAGEPVTTSAYKLRTMGYEGPYQVGSNLFSREPLTLVTNEDDPEWSAMINTIVNIFFVAEANGMTQSNAHDGFQEGNNTDLEVLAATIVSELGNYGEMYERHLEVVVPRGGLNTNYRVAKNNTGLLYSIPYGNLDPTGPGPIPGKVLESILSRGYLKCGVKSQPGFAERIDGNWFGFEIDLCRGIAAAVFGTAAGVDQVAFEELVGTESDYSLLINYDVDVLTGAPITLRAGQQDPAIGHGYTFSPSYFLDTSGESIAMATSSSDPQWSSFVYWSLMTMIYAEEQGVTQQSFDRMPLLNVFGEGFQHMLQNIVQAVGSYKEIYDRNLQGVLPRAGGNMLNKDNFSGPQQYPPPFV